MGCSIKTTWRHSSPEITQEFMDRGKLLQPLPVQRKPAKVVVHKVDVTRKKRNYSRCKPITVNGVVYKSLTQASELTGISSHTLRDKVKSSNDRTVTVVKKFYLRDLQNQKLIIDDVEYSGIREAALDLRVSESILLYKVNKAGSTTFSHRVRSNSTPVTIDGITYGSVILASKRTGISYSTVTKLAKQQMKA